MRIRHKISTFRPGKMKIRLDNYLVEQGLSPSIEKVRREIITGWVKIDGETIRDPSYEISKSEKISVERPGGKYVSRGGDKLERALDFFRIDLNGKTAADLGASTGGFTDCLLKHGASYVYSIDVGYGQLNYSLRIDPRVRVIDRCNIRNMDRSLFLRNVDFITVDLSFLSILKTADKIAELFDGSEGVILIKPQFEAFIAEHSKGVVSEKNDHRNILNRTLRGLNSAGLKTYGLTFSPIKGPAGNIEYLFYFKLDSSDRETVCDIDLNLIENAVEESHNLFNPAD